MENNSEELETSPSSSKDMWLFLIVLDVIVLCVFGFFLYKHFSKQFTSPTPVSPRVSVAKPVAALPQETPVEETVSVTQTDMVKSTAALPQEEPEVKKVLPQEMVEEPAMEVLPQEPTVVEAPVKESLIVTVVPNSKYRRVTFRWYEPAEKVAIVSGFTNRKPQALKKIGDYWETTLSIAPGTYKFLYIIDGKNALDPYAEKKDGRSIVVVK